MRTECAGSRWLCVGAIFDEVRSGSETKVAEVEHLVGVGENIE